MGRDMTGIKRLVRVRTLSHCEGVLKIRVPHKAADRGLSAAVQDAGAPVGAAPTFRQVLECGRQGVWLAGS